MNAPEVLEAVQTAGGSLTVSGERIRYALPNSALGWSANSDNTGKN
jgi:hypothetical protein